MTLLITLVLITLVLFALFLGGGLVAQGYLYQEPADRLPLRALAGAVLVGLFIMMWVLIDRGAPRKYDTFFQFSPYTTREFTEFEAVRWTANVDGTLNLLELGVSQARQQEREITFLYPSSVAVYGLPDPEAKRRAGKVREDQWCEPRTMYGINKLYCERLGRYYEHFYRQLDAGATAGRLDVRVLRFPGLISAVTTPCETPCTSAVAVDTSIFVSG